MPVQQQRTGTNPVKVNDEVRSAKEVLRFQRMARELRLTDQILSLDVDSVSLIEGAAVGAPAWTSADGASITLDVAGMPGLERRVDVAIWLGTNAHELLHNHYTPRTNSLLMRRVASAERSTDPGIHRSWNVLEDQRIERLGLARYAPWRGYLIAALAFHIPVTHSEAWLLVAGRTWLPDGVRAIARATFVATNGDDEAKRAAELIGAYQRLAEPGDDDAAEAWDILSEFHERFGQVIPRRGGCGGAGHTEEGDPEPGGGECPHPTADEADADDSIDDDDDSQESGHDGDEGDSDDEGDGDGDEGDSDDESDGDGSDGDGESDGKSDGGDEGDDEGDGDGSDSDDGEADETEAEDDFDPSDGGVSRPGETRSISEALDDAIDEALDDDETAADLDRVVDNIDHGVSGGSDLPRKTGVWVDATDRARVLARDVTTVLSDIRDDCEAAWLRRTDSGRFSIDRWATDPDWNADNVFDLFDPGAMDASSLDLVLVLDVSGSMGSQNARLAEATWAIRQAVDRIEGTVTCLAFGDGASLMFDAWQRPDGRIFLPNLEGSTDPIGALREAHRIIADSKATNRIVIVLTDGEWYNTAQAAKSLIACGQAGAITCVVGLGFQAARNIGPGFAGAQVTACISDSSELVPIFRTLAEQSMRAAATAGR